MYSTDLQSFLSINVSFKKKSFSAQSFESWVRISRKRRREEEICLINQGFFFSPYLFLSRRISTPLIIQEVIAHQITNRSLEFRNQGQERDCLLNYGFFLSPLFLNKQIPNPLIKQKGITDQISSKNLEISIQGQDFIRERKGRRNREKVEEKSHLTKLDFKPLIFLQRNSHPVDHKSNSSRSLKY